MRFVTPVVKIGKIKIGSKNPVAIQSMTNTDTANATATAKQCMELADAGAELVRITVNNEKAAAAVPKIRKILDAKGYKDLPLIGDFHYNGHSLLEKFPETAKTLDKYRINPGNVGGHFDSIIKIAKKLNKPVRIGGNWGSMDDKDMVKNIIASASRAEKLGLKQNQIVLSVKTSEVQDTVEAYELLVKKTAKHPYAIHLGLTEAGSAAKGLISSSAALAILLQKGIGDTIRISLTPKPDQSRTEEVKACRILLQALGLRQFHATVTSCPGCGRTDNKVYQHLAAEVEKFISKTTNFPPIKIAVMGCHVNGPGEARHADIALCLPGKSEEKIAQVYKKGKFCKNLVGKNIIKEFLEILKSLH